MDVFSQLKLMSTLQTNEEYKTLLDSAIDFMKKNEVKGVFIYEVDGKLETSFYFNEAHILASLSVE